LAADAIAGKQTYPALLGLQGAQKYAAELAEQASALAQRLPARQATWLALVNLFTTRQT